MRHVLLFISVLLLGLTWAVAQNSSPSSSSSSSSSSSGQMSQSSAGGETTVEGCLSGSSGSYTLTDKNGTAYQLTGDTAKLSEHVGHEVKITGTKSSASSATGASGASSSSTGSTGSQTLEVSSMKHISKTCRSGTGGMSH